MKFAITFFILALGAPVALSATEGDFSRTLSVGMRGHDVRMLQVALNRDPETRVANVGVGSQGYESDYFGPATKMAVVRFQEKYRTEVLTPVGLLRGTGVFGQKTRAKVLAISQNPTIGGTLETSKPIKQVGATSSEALFSTLVPWTPDMVVPEGVNPNSINLEYYVAVSREVAKERGMSDQEIVEGERMIRERAATTTDFRKEFFKAEKIASLASQSSDYAIWPKFKKLLSDSGVIKVAEAALGIHFGGRIYFASPCTCTGGAVWQVAMIPRPPTYVPFLAYTLGTQTKLGYTLPFSSQVLGVYSPGDPICWDIWWKSCGIRFYPPNWGVILPGTGSSIL